MLLYPSLVQATGDQQITQKEIYEKAGEYHKRFNAGVNPEKNYNKARAEYKKIHNHPFAMTDLGVMLLKHQTGNKRHKKELQKHGFALIQKAAEQHNFPIAWYDLGVLYDDGLYGISKAPQKAIECYQKAGDEPSALFNLAMLYEEGRSGIPKNLAKAKKLYQLAIENDSPDAPNSLGLLLEEEGNIQEAITYYCIGVKRNDSNAKSNLALLYLKQKEWDKACNLLEELIGKPDPDPEDMFHLAKVYAQQKNTKAAAEMLKQSATGGNGYARYQLGMYYKKKRDFDNAKYLLKKAAHSHQSVSTRAQFELGNVHVLTGHAHEAEKLLKVAANPNNGNNVSAQRQLGIMHTIKAEKAQEEDKKALYTTAAQYFNLAAQQNDIEALYNLATMMLHGLHLPNPDFHKAKELYEQVIAQAHHQPNNKFIVFSYNHLGALQQILHKNYQKALDYYRHAGGQGYIDGWLNAGSLYLNRKIQDDNLRKPKEYLQQAAVYYQKALELDPQHSFALKQLDSIGKQLKQL